MDTTRTADERKRRLLLVEDDHAVSEALVDLLAMLEHHADAAASGAKALELFERHRYDLVLTDLLMPGMTGWEVLAAVRAGLEMRLELLLHHRRELAIQVLRQLRDRLLTGHARGPRWRVSCSRRAIRARCSRDFTDGTDSPVTSATSSLESSSTSLSTSTAR